MENVLALNVGGTKPPLIFSIEEYNPDKIVFFPSEGTYLLCGKILERVSWSEDKFFYSELMEIFKEYKNKIYLAFKEHIPHFPTPVENEEFYLHFLDFLDDKNFKNDKDFYKTFENYLKDDEYEFKNLFTLNFVDDIRRDIDFSQNIQSVHKSHDNSIKEFLDSNFNSIFSGVPVDDYYIFIEKIDDHENLNSAFSLAEKVFSNFTDVEKYNVRVDITGGTKTMAAGTTLAVVETDSSNFKFAYVGSDSKTGRTKRNYGTVKTGMEIYKKSFNPIKHYAKREISRGKNFFDEYQFSAALKNFESAQEGLSNVTFDNDEDISKHEKQKELVSFYIELTKFYDKWDKFYDKYSGTGKNKKTMYDKICYFINKIDGNSVLSNEFKDTSFYKQLINNRQFLSYKLIGCPYGEDYELEIKDRLRYYLADLFNNAERRYDEGKYDDSVARLYRINELIAQIFLTNEDLMVERLLKDKVFKIDVVKARKKAKKLGIENDIDEFIYKKNSYALEKNGTVLRLSNDKSYDFLEYFGYQKSANFNKLNKDLKDRNTSILAHGLKHISDKNAKKLCKSMKTYAKGFFIDLEENMELAAFPKFNEIEKVDKDED